MTTSDRKCPGPTRKPGEPIDRGDLERRIVAALRAEPAGLTSLELQERLGVSQSYLDRELRRLRGARRLAARTERRRMASPNGAYGFSRFGVTVTVYTLHPDAEAE